MTINAEHARHVESLNAISACSACAALNVVDPRSPARRARSASKRVFFFRIKEIRMRTLAWTLMAASAVLVPFRAHAQVPASLSSSAPLAARVACFSPQRAFAESADGKATLTRLSALQNERARAIEDRNKALQAQEQALERNSALLSESARTQKTAEVQKLRIDVQRFIEDAQAELMGIQRDAENAFVVKLKPALAKVAQDKGLQIVFNVDDGPVAWFDPSVDITSDVIKQLALK
jgi:Skp family chaperone for outer membrane proteins